MVVVEQRVFVRSWNDKPTGWYRAFRKEPLGTIHFGAHVERAVRAVPVRSARLREAVSAAYAEKYDTRASQKWVDGFAQPDRAAHTLELTPRYSVISQGLARSAETCDHARHKVTFEEGR